MKFLLHLFFLINVFNLSAATVTWLGGAGSWNNPALWDIGIVPTASDDVIIPSGTVRVNSGNNAFATHVHIQSGARLIIRNGGFLEIHNTVGMHGLWNEGIFTCAGLVDIADITNPVAGLINGFTNDGNVLITASGTIFINNIEGNGLQNNEGAIFENRGDLLIDLTTNIGLYNRATFRNKGEIMVSAGVNSGNGIFNAELFDNYPGAIIFSYECGENNLQNGGIGNLTPIFRNRGNITLENAGEFGLYTSSSGFFTNYEEGNISTHYASLSGIYIRAGGSIDNYGNIQSYYASGNALQSDGVLNNSGELFLMYAGLSGYRSILSSSEFHNSGEVRIQGSGSFAVYEQGIFHNTVDAYFSIDGQFYSNNPISNINDGFLISEYTSNHIIHVVNPLINYGVIEDQYDAFGSSLIDNQQVIFRSVIGTAQVGVPITDFLDIAALDRVNIIEWYIHNNTASPVAGTYDEVANTFTPDLALLGQDHLYAEVEIIASGKSRLVRIDLESAVIPLVAIPNTPGTYQNPVEVTNDLAVFPNPTNGPVQLQSSHWKEEAVQLQLVNTLGQVVQQSQLIAGGSNVDFSFATTLPAGLYHLQLVQEDKVLAWQKVVLKK